MKAWWRAYFKALVPRPDPEFVAFITQFVVVVLGITTVLVVVL